ncbi:sugar ABC transporter permease [Demequina sp. SYSU T00192]|uniref:Sugar ABC transporter permease n=1 Tax=Demequina litoralis TaxID=3051660 RepID=A0ABT8GB14_9MICO|nr:sugar ABC transporter permease [Demequina sp. SYSU T00192]MDN4476336.1 sugar ABC transporter permease [Demequina sp. SYSU T00192]
MAVTTVSSAESPAAPPSSRRAPRRGHRGHPFAGFLFVVPFMVLFIAMIIVPLGYAAYLSLFENKLIGGTSFVGLKNFAEALTDEAFLGGVGRMGLFLVIQVPIMLFLALFLALAIDSGRTRAARSARLLAFMPYAVPGVVATLMWGYLYGPDFGPITQAFEALGLQPPDLLGTSSILGSMMNIVTWEYVGYNMIIMYAALRAIPTELYEAAAIDGASRIRIALSIKIPAIKPAIMLTVIFSVIGTFQLFNEPALLDAIAPVVITNGFTPNFYAYNVAFVNQDVNYAAAIAFLLGLVIAVLSYVVQLSSQRAERKVRR